MGPLAAFLLSTFPLATGSADVKPRVELAFEGCPEVYEPLVGRVVAIESKVAVVDGESDDVDFRASIKCRGDWVDVYVEGAEGSEEVTVDLSAEHVSGRPRTIGLKVAYLLEEVIFDWVPEVPEPEAPPEPEVVPAPPPAPPPAPERAPEPPTVVSGDGPLPPRDWHLVVEGGLAFSGSSALVGPSVALGMEWAPDGLPFLARADGTFRFGSKDVSTGTARMFLVAPGAFAGAKLALTDSLRVDGTLGYRMGWARLEGQADNGFVARAVSAFWHGPAARVSGAWSWPAAIVELSLEVGYGVRDIRGTVSNGQRVNIGGAWTALTLGLELPLF